MPPLVLRDIAGMGLNVMTSRSLLDLREAWAISNMRGWKGKLTTAPGAKSLSPASIINPRQVFSWVDDSATSRLLVFTDTKIYEVSETSSALTDVSRAGNYTGIASWDPHVFGNKIIAAPNLATLQVQDAGGGAFRDATGAPSAVSVAPFMTYAVAGNISGASRKIQWSDAGSIDVWGTGDAGNLTIYQGPGQIYRLLPLGDVLVIYRENSIHILFYVGPPFIFAQRQVIRDHGLVGPFAVQDIGGQHIYIGTNGVYIFNGSSASPIGNKIINSLIGSPESALLDYGSPFLFRSLHVPENHDVYFFYPTPIGNLPQRSFVYNYSSGSWRAETVGGVYTGIRGGVVHKSSGSGTLNTGALAPAVVTNDGTVVFLSDTTSQLAGANRAISYEGGYFQPSALVFQKADQFCTLEFVDVDVELDSGTALTLTIAAMDMIVTEDVFSTTGTNIRTTVVSITRDGTRRFSVGLTGVWFAVKVSMAAVTQGLPKIHIITAEFTLRGDR